MSLEDVQKKNIEKILLEAGEKTAALWNQVKGKTPDELVGGQFGLINKKATRISPVITQLIQSLANGQGNYTEQDGVIEYRGEENGPRVTYDPEKGLAEFYSHGDELAGSYEMRKNLVNSEA